MKPLLVTLRRQGNSFTVFGACEKQKKDDDAGHFYAAVAQCGQDTVVLAEEDAGVFRIIRWHGPILISTDRAVLVPWAEQLMQAVREACKEVVKV